MLRYTWEHKKLQLQKKRKNRNLKSNIDIKAMTSGEHQKSCASNLLVSIKYLIAAFNMVVLFILSRFFNHAKRFQLTGHYSNLKC